MLKTTPKVEGVAGKPEGLTEFAPPQTPEKEAVPDPEKILTDLKMREALLNKLINEGHKTSDINDLQRALAETITELGKILENPEIDLLSEKPL